MNSGGTNLPAAGVPRTLVIGYGNPLRGDDGVGPAVVERLQDTLDDPALLFVQAFQLTPEMAVDIAQMQRVIFIDASVALAPGRVGIARVEPGTGRSNALGHHLDPAELLALCKVLGTTVPEGWTVAVGVASMEVGTGLSPAVASAAGRLAAHLSYWLRCSSARRPGRREQPVPAAAVH